MAQEKFLIGSFGVEKVLIGELGINIPDLPSSKFLYRNLPDKPSINDVILVDNLTLDELGIPSKDDVLNLTDEYILDCGNSAK